MQDDRWNDPSKLPLTNGPLVQVTPPGVPQFRLAADGQVVEFLVPFPVHIVDQQPWAPLECRLGNRVLSLHKPVLTTHGYEPHGRLGNQVPDAFCSIIRVHCAPDTHENSYPKPNELWSVAEKLLRWMRVKSRHYWLLHGYMGFDTLCRGSVLVQQASQISQRNFTIYGSTLIVRPIDHDLWLTLTNEIHDGLEPPASESLFCDALVSAVTGDEAKAILEMGVAVEVEITRLLRDVSRTLPNTHQKTRFASKGERDSFYGKFGEWPKKLGLQDAKTFGPGDLIKNWFDIVLELYRLRGGVAHSGKLTLSTGYSVPSFLMAANVLFDYCREQRKAAGVPIYSYPNKRRPFEQIVLFRDGALSSETNAAVGAPPASDLS